MPSIMNIKEENIDSFEKCGDYTVSVIECDKTSIFQACLFADAGFKVVGVNSNPHTLKLLKKGRTPLLKTLAHMKEGFFTVSSDARETVSGSDIVVIFIQTKVDEKKKPDYSLLEKTCKEIGMGLKRGSLVLFVSTTGPGTVEGPMREVLEKASGLIAGVDFGLAYSPTRTSSQKRLDKLSSSFRVVGAFDESSLRIANLILSRITKAEIIKVSSIKAAEAINLFQTVDRETNLALANELAFMCERLKIDFLEILKVINKDKAFHLTLPGIMDETVRRDFYLLLEEAENMDLNFRLTPLARKINDEIVDYTFRLVKDALKVCGKTVRRANVSILGIARRPNIKEPPGALIKRIISNLKKKVRLVQIYDPFFSKKELIELGFKGEKLSKVVEKTDCVVILVGHSKFERLNLKKIKFLARKSPAIVDLSHTVDPLKAEKYGFVFRGLGRGIWTK